MLFILTLPCNCSVASQTNDRDDDDVDLGIKFAGDNPLKSPKAAKDSTDTSKKDSRNQQKAKQKGGRQKTSVSATPKRKSPAEDPPKTPSNKGTNPLKKPPTSPFRMGACCSKNHRLELTEWDGSYFTAVYQKGKPNVPTHCSGYCKKQKFVGDDVPKCDVDLLTCVKITKSKQASICPNAQDPTHPCVFALCTLCKTMMDLVATGQKKEVWETEAGVWVTVDIADESIEKPVKKPRTRQPRIFLAPGERFVGNTVVPHAII